MDINVEHSSNNEFEYPFRLREVYHYQTKADLQGKGAPLEVEVTEALSRCMDAHPETVNGPNRAFGPECFFDDLFFTRPVERYFPDLRAWSSRQARDEFAGMHRMDDFVMNAFYNPFIGTNYDLENNPEGSFFFECGSHTAPKIRCEIEVIVKNADMRLPDEKLFHRDNIIGLRDRRSFIDQCASPGYYILAQLWFNQYQARYITKQTYVQRLSELYAAARDDVQRYIQKTPQGIRLMSDIQNAKARAEDLRHALEDVTINHEKKDDVRDILWSSVPKSERGRSDRSSSTFTTPEEFVNGLARVYCPTARELLKDGDKKGLGFFDYNFAHPECPVNPSKIWAFEQSVRMFRELVGNDLVDSSEQFNYGNYVDKNTGLRTYPYPRLVFFELAVSTQQRSFVRLNCWVAS